MSQTVNYAKRLQLENQLVILIALATLVPPESAILNQLAKHAQRTDKFLKAGAEMAAKQKRERAFARGDGMTDETIQRIVTTDPKTGLVVERWETPGEQLIREQEANDDGK